MVGGGVFEIYPAEGHAPASGVRLGFRVASIDDVVAKVPTVEGSVKESPRDGPWGRRAVLVDPGGVTVEITE